VISDAAELGYEVLSVSGGEPFLYAGLGDVLRCARACGMRTTVTTNGYFLDPRHMDLLCDHVDVLAISLDGPREMHNTIRGSPQAFDRLCAGLEHVRASNLTFGFIHTLTLESWVHLVWLAEFAVENGAQLLQIHPLELAGRAEGLLKQLVTPGDVLSKAYLLSVALASKYSGVMNIQLDLLHRDQILKAPELIYAGPSSGSDATSDPTPLGVIVLEPDGALVPITYGFSRRYQICDVKYDTLATAWPGYEQETHRLFRQLCETLFQRLIQPDAPPLFNWHEQIAAQSHRGASI
jgi:MoaA/NifB/PqqE/SkfB family radical SAM enzyme